MTAQVKVSAVVRPVDLPPAKWKQILYVAGLLRVMRKLLMVMKPQPFRGQPQIFEERFSIIFFFFLQGTVLSFFAEGLILHLFELNRAEGKILGRDLIAKCLSDLSDTKR